MRVAEDDTMNLEAEPMWWPRPVKANTKHKEDATLLTEAALLGAAEEYETWIMGICAVKNERGEAGKYLADEFSQMSLQYDKEEFDNKWDSFEQRDPSSEDAVSYGSVKAWTKENGGGGEEVGTEPVRSPMCYMVLFGN